MISSPARRLVDANQAHQHQPMSGIPTVVLPDPSQEVEAPQARGENHRKQVVRVRVETKVDISVFEDSSSAGEVKDCSQECSRGHRRGLLLELQQGVEGVKAKCGTDHLESRIQHRLSPHSHKDQAGTLRDAGYKSANMYLVEAKIAHIEQGWPWSHLLDRHFKLCIKAPNKAPEVV